MSNIPNKTYVDLVLKIFQNASTPLNPYQVWEELQTIPRDTTPYITGFFATFHQLIREKRIVPVNSSVFTPKNGDLWLFTSISTKEYQINGGITLAIE